MQISEAPPTLPLYITLSEKRVFSSQPIACGEECSRPTVASLFSCGGMVEVGAIWAGFRPIWGVEFDPDKPQLSTAFADCYEANIGAHVIRQPVQDVNWHSLEPPDLLWASPPCTRMSAANRNKGESDLDLELAQAICSAISTLKPKAFCLENVRAYAKSRSLQLIRDTLNLLGYGLTEAVVNAADYGVPQSRVRFFLRAVSGQFPPALPSSVVNPVGWYCAIADLIPTLPDGELAPWQLERLPPLMRTTLIDSKNASSVSGIPSCRTGEEPAFTITDVAKGIPRAFLIERSGARSDRPLLVRAASEPCWTLRASVGTDQKGNNRNQIMNARLESGRVVTLTNRALARLQTLPDSYQLPTQMKIACPLIGNGVPCKLVQVILLGLKPLLASSGKGSPTLPNFYKQKLRVWSDRQKEQGLVRTSSILEADTLGSIKSDSNSNAPPLDPTSILVRRDGNEFENLTCPVQLREEPTMIATGTTLPSELVDQSVAVKSRNSGTETQSAAAVPTEAVGELTEEEAALRHRLELKVERAFYEAGVALRELCSRRLYRTTHRTFEDYCQERFGFSRRHPYRLIEAAIVVENLEEFCVQFGHILPAKESTCRPLTALTPDQQIQAWQEVLQSTGGKHPAGHVVKGIVERLKEKPLFKATDFCQVGDVFTLTRCEGTERKYNGCPCVAVELKNFTVEVAVYDINLTVKPENLQPIDSPDVRRQLPIILKRLKRLRQCDLDRGAYPILESLGRQTYLTDLEAKLLSFLEQEYGIESRS